MFRFDVFTIAAVLLCFAYHILLFNYSARVLEKGRKNFWLHLLPTTFNTLLIFLSPLYVFQTYLIIVVIFYLEFKLLSKASHRQILCGSTMFAVHIALIHYSTTVVISSITSDRISEVLDDTTINNRLLVVVLVLLILALLLVQRVIDIRTIQRITCSPQYAEAISGMAVVFIFIITVDAYLINFYPDFPNQTLYSILTLVVMIVLIYFLLFHALKMLNLHKFKRFADQLDETYNLILMQKKEIAQKIDKDDLTGLFNRKFIGELLEEMFETNTLKLGILFVDINGLKFINDNFGHNCGDRLIMCIAKALNRTLRDDDICARIGGDEFLAILHDVTEEQMEGVKKRLNRELEMYDELEDFPVSASVGGINITDDIQNMTLSEVLALADADMRKNKVAFYESRESRYIK